MIYLNIRADVKPQQFLAVRAGQYVPLRKVDILPGERVFYYRGPGCKIEKCSTGGLC
ncbi:unnamed protein product [marine sediment metagenome]|uniref:Uncharacterized protein n=1 Tax=marine sediment metagenome TaxID=412755 RepID=X1CJL5_9ZZZZ